VAGPESAEARKLFHPVNPFTKTQTFEANVKHFTARAFEERRALVIDYFPRKLTVEIGLNIRKASPHKHAFVAGYTNGYIYYTPTAKQLENVGGAQEDSNCLLAPAWQQTFEDRVAEILRKL
jgi:hypothetical protein